MKNILYLQSSLFGSSGASATLADELISRLLRDHPGGNVTRLDLAANPLPHLDGEEFSSWTTPADQRTETQVVLAAHSDSLIEQLRQQDILVMAVPMYNLGIPSALKTWIDRVVRAGETFRYTENGPEGLLHNIKTYLVLTRGGIYKGTPLDTQTDYLKHILGLIGITDIEIIYAEGLAMGDEQKSRAFSEARDNIEHSFSKAA